MYSRHVTLQIKNNMVREFPHVFERELLPLLRKQKGFLDELILAARGRRKRLPSACGRPRNWPMFTTGKSTRKSSTF